VTGLITNSVRDVVESKYRILPESSGLLVGPILMDCRIRIDLALIASNLLDLENQTTQKPPISVSFLKKTSLVAEVEFGVQLCLVIAERLTKVNLNSHYKYPHLSL
jgi:hypothetical protein